MCGRFTLTWPDYAALAAELGVAAAPVPGSYRARFNVAPTDWHCIVTHAEDARVLIGAYWGLARRGPPRASASGLHITARIEGIGERRTFKQAVLHRRCIIPADGFFEWKTPQERGGAKQPIWFHAPPKGLLRLAGIYEEQKGAGGVCEVHFAIVTTAATDPVAAVHDRMPLMIEPDRVDDWVMPDLAEGELHDFLDSFIGEPTDLVAQPVSLRVNSVKNDDATCLEPPKAVPRTRSLFD